MKEQKVIHSAVRTEKGVFKAGQEAELEKAISADEVQRLTDLGAISGFTSKAEEKPKAKK